MEYEDFGWFSICLSLAFARLWRLMQEPFDFQLGYTCHRDPAGSIFIFFMFRLTPTFTVFALRMPL